MTKKHLLSVNKHFISILEMTKKCKANDAEEMHFFQVQLTQLQAQDNQLQAGKKKVLLGEFSLGSSES